MQIHEIKAILLPEITNENLSVNDKIALIGKLTDWLCFMSSKITLDSCINEHNYKAKAEELSKEISYFKDFRSNVKSSNPSNLSLIQILSEQIDDKSKQLMNINMVYGN